MIIFLIRYKKFFYEIISYTKLKILQLNFNKKHYFLGKILFTYILKYF